MLKSQGRAPVTRLATRQRDEEYKINLECMLKMEEKVRILESENARLREMVDESYRRGMEFQAAAQKHEIENLKRQLEGWQRVVKWTDERGKLE